MFHCGRLITLTLVLLEPELQIYIIINEIILIMYKMLLGFLLPYNMQKCERIFWGTRLNEKK